MRRARRDQEPVAGVQGEGGLALDLHAHGPGDDVADLLAGVLMPARLDAGRDLGQHLDDLPAGDRGRRVLELGALELAGEVVARLRVVVVSLDMVGPPVRWCSRVVERWGVEQGGELVGDVLGPVLDRKWLASRPLPGDLARPGAPDVEHVAVEARQRAASAPQREQRALDRAACRGRRRRARGRWSRRRGSPRRSPPRCSGRRAAAGRRPAAPPGSGRARGRAPARARGSRRTRRDRRRSGARAAARAGRGTPSASRPAPVARRRAPTPRRSARRRRPRPRSTRSGWSSAIR